MQARCTCLLLIVLLISLTKRSLAQTELHTWETHLNVRGVSGLINGESAGFLLKRRMGEKTFARLGLQGYVLSRKQTGALSHHILTRRFSVQTRPGIEWRTTINDKVYFLRGADLIFNYSGSDIITPTADQYTERQRSTSLGLSPFVGVHYTINAHFGILAEAHIDALTKHFRSEINNDFSTPNPDRIDTATENQVLFVPFQHITVCFTF